MSDISLNGPTHVANFGGEQLNTDSTRNFYGLTLLLAAIAFYSVTMFSPDASAGRGYIQYVDDQSRGHKVGEIHLYIRPAFGVSSTYLDALKELVVDTSAILADATDGYFRIGSATLLPLNVRYEDSFADIRHYSVDERSVYNGPTLGYADETGTATVGANPYLAQITFSSALSEDGLDAGVLAHEIAHAALGVGDEYAGVAQSARMCTVVLKDSLARGNDRNMGTCFESISDAGIPRDSSNTSLMQTRVEVRPGDDLGTEFCVPANHDQDQQCVDPGNSPVSNLTNQSAIHQGESVWETISRIWPWANMPSERINPSSLPDSSPPSTIREPAFFNYARNPTQYVTLVLDKSGSMAWAADDDDGEVCNDGTDNDRDGAVDEADCAVARMKYLKAGARAWLELGTQQLSGGTGACEATSPFKVSMVAYNSAPNVVQSDFVELTPRNLTTLVSKVNALNPEGTTAIGDALDAAGDLFAGLQSDPPECFTPDYQSAYLFSDGKHNDGSVQPDEGASRLDSLGVRTDTMALGPASQRSTLREISSATSGMSHQASLRPYRMVSMYSLNMAEITNADILIPDLPFHVNAEGEELVEYDSNGWVGDEIKNAPAFQQGGRTVVTQVNAAPGTQDISFIVAGTMDKMSDYDTHMTLVGPDGETWSVSDGPRSGIMLSQDPFFTAVTIRAKNGVYGSLDGQWQIRLTRGPESAADQYGTLTVFAHSPQPDAYFGLSNTLIDSSGGQSEVTAHSRFRSRLRNHTDARVVVTSPDGTSTAFTVVELDSGVVESTLSGLGQIGSYEVEMMLETTKGQTWNDPGEPTPGMPSMSQDVPDMTFNHRETIFVTEGEQLEFGFREEEGR